MSDGSGIEWTDATWNPVTGCTQIPGPKGAPSGCDHCYAKTLLDTRMAANPKSARFGLPFERVLCHPERLHQPYLWTKPRKIFVNSLSDLFHVDVPVEFIDKVFTVMGATPRHTFQVLTKRPERMQRYLSGVTTERILLAMDVFSNRSISLPGTMPFPNVWLGVSIATNDDAWRADMLRERPAAVRFLSVEPLLGSVDKVSLAGIDWVIAGGESGKGARPMDPAWVRHLRDRCVAARIPFFLKQWGEYAPWSRVTDPAWMFNPKRDVVVGDFRMRRVGKKNAGAELDGRVWREFPERAAVPA